MAMHTAADTESQSLLQSGTFGVYVCTLTSFEHLTPNVCSHLTAGATPHRAFLLATVQHDWCWLQLTLATLSYAPKHWYRYFASKGFIRSVLVDISGFFVWLNRRFSSDACGL
jgi:hypothetical protein